MIRFSPTLLARAPRPQTGAALVAFLLAAQTPALLAHDFWIEPSAFRVEVGARVSVSLRVGEHYKGDPVPRNPARIRKLTLVGQSGETEVPGKDGDDPAGTVIVPAAGLYLIGYHNRPSSITLEAPKFEAYLKEEGLEQVSTQRAERGESEKPAREIYSRCAKALLRAGAGAAGGHDRRLGLPLELVPEADPYDEDGAASLPVRLLLRGPAARRRARRRALARGARGRAARPHRPRRPSVARARARPHLAGEGGAHGEGAGRLERRLGEPVGVAHVRIPMAHAQAASLIRRLGRGDHQALGEFYDLYAGLVNGLAVRILRDRAEAEDAVQEVFVQVWQQASRFDPARGTPEAWLCTMARSRALDRLRRRSSRREDPEQDGGSATHAPRNEEALAVRKALDGLPEDQRRALELAYYEGLTQSEIAEHLSQPLGTVKTRIRAAMIRLRDVLGPTP